MINPNTRVNQLDATLLDQELFNNLHTQLSSVFTKISPIHKTKYSNEIKFILNSLLFKFTIWDKSQSYGLFLQNLKYKDLTRLKKLVYFVVFIFGSYISSKYQSLLYEENETTTIKERLVSILKKSLIKFQSIYKILSFLNFIDFLITGNYQSLKLRLLNIKTSVFSIELAKLNKGNISFEFQNRQLIWNTFLEFILFILPILSNSKVQQTFDKLLTNQASQPRKLLNHLSQSQCSICHESKAPLSTITNPYQANCGHVFCYICLLTKLEHSKNLGQEWKCNRCGEKVVYGKPFNDVLESAAVFKLEAVDVNQDIEKTESTDNAIQNEKDHNHTDEHTDNDEIDSGDEDDELLEEDIDDAEDFEDEDEDYEDYEDY